MFGMVLEPPFAQRSCRNIQIIGLITIGHAAGMMAFWHQNHIMILRRHGFIQAAILGENPLMDIALFVAVTGLMGLSGTAPETAIPLENRDPFLAPERLAQLTDFEVTTALVICAGFAEHEADKAGAAARLRQATKINVGLTTLIRDSTS